MVPFQNIRGPSARAGQRESGSDDAAASRERGDVRRAYEVVSLGDGRNH